VPVVLEAAEQVGELEGHERGEDGVDDDQHDQRLGRPKTAGRDDRGGPRRGAQRRALHAGKPDGRYRQQPGREPRAGRDEGQPTAEPAEVDLPTEDAGQATPEDRVGR
jgi:hypothetical protein